jgi:hypothetical protein
MQVLRESSQRLFQFSAPHPLLESAVAGLEGRIFFGQFTPLRPGAQDPEHTVQDGECVVPRTTTPVGSAPRPQHRLHHFPLLVGQLPTATHRRIRRSAERLQSATKAAFTYL